MGFSRPEYWSGLPFPLPGDLPDAGIKPGSLMSPALAGRLPKHFVCNMVNMIQTEESGFNLKVLFVVAWSTRFVGHSMWKYSNWEKMYKKRVGQRPGFHLIVSLWMHYLTSLVLGVICLVSLWGQESRCSQWQESLEVISPGADTYVGLGSGKVGIFWFTSLRMCKWVLTSQKHSKYAA